MPSLQLVHPEVLTRYGSLHSTGISFSVNDFNDFQRELLSPLLGKKTFERNPIPANMVLVALF